MLKGRMNVRHQYSCCDFLVCTQTISNKFTQFFSNLAEKQESCKDNIKVIGLRMQFCTYYCLLGVYSSWLCLLSLKYHMKDVFQ